MAVNRTRKTIWEESTSLDLEYSTLGGALKEIQNLIERHGADAKIESHAAAYSDSDKEYLYVMTPRPENDDEYNKRIKNEELYQAQQDERDEREFKRLQEKFKDKK
jgi:hypothetical protein